jgi:glycosyltransferase involved in cell wall biosynthesis
MASNPKVSILIPLYNAEKYIAETIKSALNQTWPNIEVIIVDDGSTDNSYAIAKSFESDKVKVYQQENKWGSAARNKAFGHSSGEYIQYLDADDILAPTKIEEQMKLLLETNDPRAIANCRYARFKKDLSDAHKRIQKIDKSYENPIDWIVDSFNGKGTGLVSLWLTPRKIIEETGDWNEKLKFGDDGEFFCRALLNTSRIMHIPQTLFYYRDTYSSVSKSRTIESAKMYLIMYDSISKAILPKYNNFETRKVIACQYSIFYFLFYPNYPDLLKEAEMIVKELGFKTFPKINLGKAFTLVQFFLGFRRATNLFYKIKNR